MDFPYHYTDRHARLRCWRSDTQGFWRCGGLERINSELFESKDTILNELFLCKAYGYHVRQGEGGLSERHQTIFISLDNHIFNSRSLYQSQMTKRHPHRTFDEKFLKRDLEETIPNSRPEPERSSPSIRLSHHPEPFISGSIIQRQGLPASKSSVSSDSSHRYLQQLSGVMNGHLCALSQRKVFSDKMDGHSETSHCSGVQFKSINSDLRLTYWSTDIFLNLLSISVGADAGWRFCWLLRMTLRELFRENWQHLDEFERVRIKELLYHWIRELQSLNVDFSSGRQGRGFEQHLEFEVKANPGGVISSRSSLIPRLAVLAPVEQDIRESQRPRYRGLLAEGKKLLLPQVCELVQWWIQQCQECCEQETENANLPTRLLYVGSINGKWEDCLLVPTSGRSQGTMSRPLSYAVLSHCWGDPAVHQPPFKTTTGNFSSMLRGIHFQILPKNYQHAIIVCRSMNIQYIWIDSLCIIQDDKIDWENESPKMAQYYEHAYITIIPAAASSCHDGFLDRIPTNDSTVGLDFQPSDDRIIQGTYRLGSHFAPEPVLFYDDVAESKWGTRGWTFCEGIFSKRRVYFGKNTIYWSCRKFYASGLNNSMKDAEEHNLRSLIEEQAVHPGKNDFSIWYAQFLEYSCRELSRFQDRLPAISSLAKVIAEMTGSQYLAGLWRSDLHVGLLWYASDFEGSIILPGETEAPYIAPSWSWLARAKNAEVSDHALMRKTRPYLEVLDAGTTPDGINPFGRVLDGFIKIRGQICKLPENISNEVSSNEMSLPGKIMLHGQNFDLAMDSNECSKSGFVNDQAHVLRIKSRNLVLLVVRDGFCLNGTMSTAGKEAQEKEARSAISGLVLMSIRGTKNEYCRAGIFQSLPGEDGQRWASRNCDNHTLKII